MDQLDLSGKTPLHCACWFGNESCVAALLAKKANVNIQDKAGDTPLHFACLHNRIGIVTLLLNSGADTTLTNQAGKKAEDIAEDYDRVEIVQLLTKKEGDIQLKNRPSILYANISYEQHQMNKKLAEMVENQNKQSEIITQLKSKVIAQSDSLAIMQSQQQQMRNQLNDMEMIASNIQKLLRNNRFIFSFQKDNKNGTQP